MQRLTDEEYKFVFERVPRLCLDFVVVKNGKILLAKRNIEPCKGCWCMPGGMLRYKESIDEAADRILEGEIGLKAVEKRLIGFVELPDEVNENGINVHSVSIAFLTKLEEGELIGSSEASEIKFFDSLPSEVNPNQAEFLQKNWDKIIK